MDWFDAITALLTNHRHPQMPARPEALTRHQIITLLKSNLSPSTSHHTFTTEIATALRELQAQGEILVGTGNRYCMAPPIVLAQDRSNLSELLFQGDRAYLAITHNLLKTEQLKTETRIRPNIGGFHRLQDCLNQIGVRVLTASDSVQRLPDAQKPLVAGLRTPWQENPFLDSKLNLQRYVPRRDVSQADRWQFLEQGQIGNEQLTDETLLKLPTGEYLWFMQNHFYELDPDTATLAMFHQDREAGCPLKVIWDELQGRLNLQGIVLPSFYAQWIWRLSQPGQEGYRIRYISASSRPLVKSAFHRLGCSLV